MHVWAEAIYLFFLSDQLIIHELSLFIYDEEKSFTFLTTEREKKVYFYEIFLFYIGM